jgi:two-component system chemotaxis response regulator CheY
LTIWVWAGHGERDDDRGFSSSGTGKTGERAGARVLVVDDDSSILDTVTSILLSEGFQVMAANGGQQALGLLNSWHPTLVLLDMRMPIMDGWAVAAAMKDAGSKVPIVVMTAAESAKKWADEIGAAGHLAKPFLLDELIDCVERYSRERRN